MLMIMERVQQGIAKRQLFELWAYEIHEFDVQRYPELFEIVEMGKEKDGS